MSSQAYWYNSSMSWWLSIQLGLRVLDLRHLADAGLKWTRILYTQALAKDELLDSGSDFRSGLEEGSHGCPVHLKNATSHIC